MADKDIPSRLIDYIVAGATQDQAAAALGVSKQYISDLFADDDFKERLSSARIKVLDKRVETENIIRDVEQAAITRIKGSMSMIMDPMKLLQVFKVANAARTSQAAQPVPITSSPIVQLTLPIQLVNNFVTDGANKIISIGDKTMVTLQTASLEGLANDHARPQIENHSQPLIQQSSKKQSELEKFGLPASAS